MSTLTAELIVSLIDRVTAPARSVAGSVGKLRDAAERNTRKLNAMRGRMLDAAGAGYLLAKAISSPARAAMEFESAMADVRKVVDFESPAAFKQMSSDIVGMSREIAVSATDLAAIMANLGAAGTAEEALLPFTKLVAKAAVAFDVSADNASKSLTRIRTNLGLTVEQTGLLADGFNHLSNNMAATSSEISDYMMGVGAIGKQSGFTGEQTAAIGAAMIAGGAQANVAATSFRNVNRALARGESATRRQRDAYEKLGLSATNVAKRLQQDGVGTLNDVFARIRALPKEVQSATISDLFGDEARAIMPLIENTALLRKALSLVSNEMDYAGSVAEEYAVRSATAENKFQLQLNKVNALAIALGNALLPALTSAAEAFGPVIDAMTRFAEANPQVTTGIVLLVGSLVALRVATIATRWSFLFLKGGLIDAGMAAGRAAGMIVAATSRLRVAILGATMLSAVGGGTIFSGLVAGATSAAAAIGPAIATIVGALTTVSAPIWLIIGGVAALSLAIYRYWEPISGFVVGFAKAIYGAVEPLIEFLSAAAGRIASAIAAWATDRIVDIAKILGFDPDAVRTAVDAALAKVASFAESAVKFVREIPGRIGDWVSQIFTVKDYSDAAEASFREAGRRAGQALVNAIKKAISDLIEWFKGLPDRIMRAIGNIDFSSVIKWPSLPSWFGGGAPEIDGAKAAGGPVLAGRTYLVGERGPELFTPTTSGQIIPNHALPTDEGAARSAAVLPSSPTAAPEVHVNVTVDATTGANADDIGEEVALQVSQILDEKLREAMSGTQADGEWAVG